MTIERFFLRNLLRISLAGSFLILVTDLILYAQDALSTAIDIVIVSACVLSFVLMKKYYTLAALIFTGFTLIAMVYQCFAAPMNTTTSMSIILILGFIFSILLKGSLLWIMHGITCICIVVIFIAQTQIPALRVSPDASEVVTIAITYGVLYGIISYCTITLKTRYDETNQALRNANVELISKANEIEAQHEELIQNNESMNELNKNLERMVMERTAKVHAQNEMLLKYTYTNAHHLRGPVARLLGLITIHKLEANPDYNFFFNKMEEQAKEIDDVVKQINSELDNNG